MQLANTPKQANQLALFVAPSSSPTSSRNMIYAVVALPIAALAANNAEISTSNLNGGGAAFDNLKASWGKALNIGDFKTNMNLKYDYAKSKDSLQEVSFSGNLVEDGDMTVGYEVTRSFDGGATAVKVSAETGGTTLCAEYDTDEQLKEVSASRTVDVSDRKVDVEPSWLVKAKKARVKLMSALGDSDSVRAQVDYDTNSGDTAVEVGFSRQLKEGKSLSATLTPASKDLEVELVDSSFEQGATWTATANVGLDDASSIADNAKVTLKRSWAW